VELPKEPCLILANHVSNYDPFFLGAAMRGRHTYFVCADNIMRKAWIRKFFSFFLAPIVHIKGKSGLGTVSEMLRRLKSGVNVAIFPEGNRTFNGRTQEMLRSIGKLAKKSGANLVLFCIEGGYFTEPRWGTNLRRGRVHVKNKVYTVSELETMSVEEVTKAISDALYTDAYAEQEEKPTAFYGKNLCLGMEAGLYRCPSCGGIDCLKSNATSVFCDCGFHAVYDRYGYLNTGERHTVTEYMDAQRAWLLDTVRIQRKERSEGLADAKERTPLFEDKVFLQKVTQQYEISPKREITIRAYCDHAEAILSGEEARTVEVYTKDVDSLAIFSRNLLTIFFPKNPVAYEMRGGLSFNALKYRDLYEIICAEEQAEKEAGKEPKEA